MKPIGMWFGGIAVVAVLAWLSYFVIFRNYLIGQQLQGLSDQERAEFWAWMNDPVELPDKALEVDYPSAELRAKVAAFYEAYKADEALIGEIKNRLFDGQPGEVTPDERDQLLETIEPFLESYTSVLADDGFAIEFLQVPMTSDDFDSSLELAAVLGTQLLNARAQALLDRGELEEAFRLLETTGRVALSDSYSELITRLIFSSLYAMNSQAWHKAVMHCEDADLLRETLKVQNALALDNGLASFPLPASISDDVATLRQYRRLGIPVRMKGLTGRELMEEADLVGYHKLSCIREQLRLSGTSAGIDPETVFLDLLRLHTAHKLFRIERGREPESIDELVPDYLPAIPRDPSRTDGGTYGTKPEYYSIGPDGIDNGASQICETVLGPGDLVITR